VSRWKELCRVWRKAQLQSKHLFALFFHCAIIVYCFASIDMRKRTMTRKNSHVVFFFGLQLSAQHEEEEEDAFKCIIVICCFVAV
jgi:hypothetical protein